MKESSLPASEFKAKCLGLLDEVAEKRSSFIITKRGKPVARVIPMPGHKKRSEDVWKQVKIVGDLVSFHDDWNSDQ
jgi:prevent-host-death family protein